MYKCQIRLQIIREKEKLEELKSFKLIEDKVRLQQKRHLKIIREKIKQLEKELNDEWSNHCGVNVYIGWNKFFGYIVRLYQK